MVNEREVESNIRRSTHVTDGAEVHVSGMVSTDLTTRVTRYAFTGYVETSPATDPDYYINYEALAHHDK